MPTGPYLLDVNETLIDMGPLDSLLERVTGVPGVRGLWFATALRTAFAHTLIRRPVPPFGTVAAGALEVVAAGRGRTVTDADRDELAATFARLPLHPDVEPALRRLRAGGERLVVCAQAPEDVLRAQLAPVADCVEAWVSAGDRGAFKPAPEPYRAALDVLGEPTATMVAAHPWDLAGAAACGLATVLVRRPGVVEDPAFPAHDRVVADLSEL